MPSNVWYSHRFLCFCPQMASIQDHDSAKKKPPSPVNTILTNYNAIISPPIHPWCQYQHRSWNTLCHTIILTQYHANTPSMLWTIFPHLHHPPPRSTPDSWSSTICWLLYRAQILVVLIYITCSLSRAGWTIVFWPLWCVQVVVSSSSEYLTTNKQATLSDIPH